MFFAAIVWPEPGQMVRVLEGAFRDVVGAVTDINRAEKKVLVLLQLFGRPIKTWLTLDQLEKAYVPVRADDARGRRQ